VVWGVVLPVTAHLINPNKFTTGFAWLSGAIFGSAYFLFFGFVMPWIRRRFPKAPPP
jgi:hypothetical protein